MNSVDQEGRECDLSGNWLPGSFPFGTELGGRGAVKKHPVLMLYGCCAISRYNEDDTGWSLGLIPTYMGFLLSTINPVGS